ncbi:TRAP transporter small permease [Chloroflexota bacterium]
MLDRKGESYLLKRVARVLWEAPISLQRVIIIVLAVGLSVLVVAEVAVRYVVHVPILWVEELAVYLIFWFYLTGTVYATYRRRHIVGGITQLFFKDKPRFHISFQVMAAAISGGLCCLMVYLSFDLFTYNLKVNPRTIHLFLPLSYSWLALLCTFPLMALYFLLQFLGSVRDLIRGVSTVPLVEVLEDRGENV